jgi:hypothetical protein
VSSRKEEKKIASLSDTRPIRDIRINLILSSAAEATKEESQVGGVEVGQVVSSVAGRSACWNPWMIESSE